MSGEQIRAPLRVLVTGASGWLGQFLLQALEKLSENAPPLSYEVFGTYSRVRPGWADRVRASLLPLTLESRESVREVLEAASPDVIVHLAAMSSPAHCERDSSKGLVVNAPSVFIEEVEAFSSACAFIFTSTDLVYDGEKEGPLLSFLPPFFTVH